MTRQFNPHDYQIDITRHITSAPRVAVWAPMGGGKTVSVLTALEELTLTEQVYPVLVLAPKRVALSTWPDEVAKWAHTAHLRVSPIIGTAAEREAAFDRPADVYTMNYENIPWLIDLLVSRKKGWPFPTIVADEASRLKSYRTKQGGLRAQKLAQAAYASRRFIELTGTPSSNGLIDLWGQLWFLDKGARLLPTFEQFKDRWFRLLPGDGKSRVYEPLVFAMRQISAKVSDICRTISALQVDEPNFVPVMVKLPPAARKMYRQMEREMFAELAEGTEVAAFTAAAKSMKLLQFANGAVYHGENGEWAEVHAEKLDALESIIEEAGGAPVLVAYHFKSDLARLQKRFPKGRVLDAKPQTIRDWNAGKIPILFAHPASAGHGLNLAQGGSILVFFSLNWNLEEHQQIIERIGPMRQKQGGFNRPVLVYKIMAEGTIDGLVEKRLTGKASVQHILLEAAKNHHHVADDDYGDET